MVLGVVVTIMLWYAPRPYIFFFFLILYLFLIELEIIISVDYILLVCDI